MKYTAEILIKELYDTTPEYNSSYTLEEFSEVCLTPLIFFRKKMKEPTLPSMRFKFMGVFQVYPSIIAKMLHYNQIRYNKGIVTKETYDEFNNEMVEVHKQLQATYRRGKVNIIYNDEPSTPSNQLQEEQA